MTDQRKEMFKDCMDLLDEICEMYYEDTGKKVDPVVMLHVSLLQIRDSALSERVVKI